MYENGDYKLRPAEKIDILYRLFKGEKISDLIHKLDDHDVIGMQHFIWETAAEFGVICYGKNFTRETITRKMTPTSKYQQQQSCTERAYNCKGTHCIHSNPDCARKKIQGQIDIMVDYYFFDNMKVKNIPINFA
jgi:hypothetical protein